MSVGTIGDSRITRATVTIPGWGVGYIDCELDAPDELTGAVTVRIADVSIAATVTSGGKIDGAARYRLAFGAGGWGRELPAKGYSTDAGVRRQTLITDAASACGETVSGTTTERVGPNYSRPVGPASSVLPSRGWYVGLDGVTRLGAWPESTYDGPAVRSTPDLARGVVSCTTETLAGLVPGALVDGVRAVDVVYELDAKTLKVRVYGKPGAQSRMTDALRKTVGTLFRTQLKFQGTYEYRVVSQGGERLNLQPVRTVTGLPVLTRVPVRLPPGVKATWLPGSLCLVTFVDADPGRAVVVAGDAPDSPGWMPLALELGGPGAVGVALLGSTVQAGPFAGAVTSASLRVKAVL